MSWNTLTVIAAEAPLGAGAAIGQPIVRDEHNRIFVVRDVLNKDPYPNMLIDEQELRSGDIGSFVSVPSCPAKRGFLTIVISPEFHSVLKEIGPRDNLEWKDSDSGGFRFVYAEMHDVKKWRDTCADSFLAWSKSSLSAMLRGGRDSQDRAIENVLRQVHFITDEGSSRFREMYMLLGVLLTNCDYRRWNAIKNLVVYELDMDQALLDKSVEEYKNILIGNCPPRRIFEEEEVERAHGPAYVMRAA